MKWAVIFFCLIATFPISAWLRGNPQIVPTIWIAVGILPFAVGPFHLYLAPLSWADWPGYVKGLEVTGIDIASLAILLSLPRSSSPLPFKVSMLVYLVAVFVSASQALVPEAALFYPFQLARVFLFFSVVAKASAVDGRVAPSLLRGMLIGICFEACLMMFQRLVLGELQAVGTIGHQNGVGMLTNLIVFPFVALLLAGANGWEPVVAPVAGVVVTLLTVSRAALGLEGLGFAIVFSISSLRIWTNRKGLLALLAVLALIVLAPIAMLSMETRFTLHPETEYDERAAFERAASAIVAENPFGVGANHYTVFANVHGYNERAGVIPTPSSLSANVHNVYFLVTAETGWLGLVTFLGLILRPLVLAFVSGWRARNRLEGDLLLGLGVSLSVIYIHSLFEWIFVTYLYQYFFAAISGLIVGLS